MGTRRRRVSGIYFISKRVKWDDSRMEFISNCTADAILNAAKALKDGHLVAFPTETVYGLGADATNAKAISRIYSVKGRPTDHPLIVHISSINKLADWATDLPDYAIKLAREFWPGPMTLILPRSEMAKDFITGGQNNVGLRVPDQPIALALLRMFEELGGKGVAAPSANKFGAVSPTTAEDVNEELAKFLTSNDLVLSNSVESGSKSFDGFMFSISAFTNSSKPESLIAIAAFSTPRIVTSNINSLSEAALAKVIFQPCFKNTSMICNIRVPAPEEFGSGHTNPIIKSCCCM
jgi:tRNA threonylcarbamoyl adenosine modification protein (Sua5/YciO/YrdC/YwlC family)